MYKKYSGSGRRTAYGGANKRSFGRSGRKQKQFSDISRFINPAMPAVEEVVYEPVNRFEDFQINEALKRNVLAGGYTAPTPIQDQTIMPALEGRDVVGIANTGTGKTAAFLIPMLNKVLTDRNQNVLIIAPTRELALQINQEFIRFSAGLNVFSVCVVGGMPIYRQISDLRRSYNVVIGTPGRIKDLVNRGNIRLDRFQNIVLDEADRMLDMGFIGDMREIMSAMPKGRQTLFFSATLSHDIQRIINEFLTDPVKVSVKSHDTARTVDQNVVYVRSKPKLDLLQELLDHPECTKAIVFGSTKHGVERLSEALMSRGVKAQSIHGDKNHHQRQRALRAFTCNEIAVLVATDVAARGLDIPNVSHVINYELPASLEDYIHRIGRTGRGGKPGKALTFID